MDWFFDWPLSAQIVTGIVGSLVGLWALVEAVEGLVGRFKTHWPPIHKGLALRTARRPKVSLLVLVAVGAAIGSVAGAVVWRTLRTAPSSEVRAGVPQAQPLAPTAIFMETQMLGLPIQVAPNSAINVVGLNKGRLLSKGSVNWGFQKFSNDGSKPISWPNKAVMEKAKQTHTAALAWRVRVINHGGTILRATIPIKLWFGSGQPPKEVIYNAIIAPLVSGATFDFYLVNDCPIQVSGAWPDAATVQVLGESGPRVAPINRTFQSPVDQIMIFMPSQTRFVGDYPCDSEPEPTKEG